MPEPYPATVIKLPLEELTPTDILSDLSTILASGFGELRVTVQDGRILTSSTTIHRRRANNRSDRATLSTQRTATD